MKIGSLGDIVFQTSENKIHTFNNFSRSISSNFHEHKRHLLPSLLEFSGAAQETISINIQLSVNLGIKVYDEIKKLREYCRTGKVLRFVIGKVAFGNGNWVITSFSCNNSHFLDGVLIYADCSLTLQNYEQRGKAVYK
jgi:phage protein U